jgi:hypothetical protein
MSDEGLMPSHTARLLELANRYQLLCLIDLNIGLRDELKAEMKQLKSALRACIVGPVKKINLNDDARGATVKLILASGRYNSFAGAEEGYCVPTRDFTAATTERVNRDRAMHWEAIIPAIRSQRKIKTL